MIRKTGNGFRKDHASTTNLECQSPQSEATDTLSAEMFGQFQALRLVIRADAAAIELIRSGEHLLVHQATDDLPMLEDERHFARAHFEHGARAQSAGARIAETGIEEAGI